MRWTARTSYARSLVLVPRVEDRFARVGVVAHIEDVGTLPDGSDALGIRTKGMWCMAYDHRIVDGADADRFLADVRATLHAFPEQQG